MDSNKQVVNSALTATEREHESESELTEQQDALSLLQLLSSAALLLLRLLRLLLRLLFTFVAAAATVIIFACLLFMSSNDLFLDWLRRQQRPCQVKACGFV